MSTLEDKIGQLCTEMKVPQPIEFLTQVMAGHDPRQLSNIYNFILELEAANGEGKPPDEWDWQELVMMIKERYQFFPVTLAESHSAAKQIMEYTHAKKKQVEHAGTVGKSNEISELSTKEVKRFTRKFNHEY